MSAAARTATAIARSKCGPRLGRSAGDSSTVMRRVLGQVKSLLVTAARQRSRASVIEASGRPTRAVPMQPVGEVDLDVDDVADGALQGDGVGGGDHQPTPRTCSTSAAPRSASSTPTRSIRIPSGCTSCSSSQRAASCRSRAPLAGVTASSGWPYAAERARLDLAEHEHVTVAQHQVDLAGVAAPVAVDEDHAGVDQPLGGDPFAVGPEPGCVRPCSCAAAHRGQRRRARRRHACGRSDAAGPVDVSRSLRPPAPTSQNPAEDFGDSSPLPDRFRHNGSANQDQTGRQQVRGRVTMGRRSATSAVPWPWRLP